MSRVFVHPDRLLDRPWQPGHPFRPRLSATRRWLMLIMLVALCAIIGGYAYLTDAQRVRAMAESYLSEELLGGRVEVGRATLSIFEGLRFDRVKVYVDETDRPDSLLFSAESFVIRYSLRSMLAGRLQVTQIVAIDPHVRLTEDLESGRWNYQRLRRKPGSEVDSVGAPAALPEILLRNAQVAYSEIRDGRHVSLGSMAIEGRLSPTKEPGRFLFELQSRGAHQGVGPVVRGWVEPESGSVLAGLANFEFGQDIKAMLPAEVRQWAQRHELAGEVDVPRLEYYQGANGLDGRFAVETALKGVTLTVLPEQWLSRAENEALAAIRRTLEAAQIGTGPLRNPRLSHLTALLEPVPIKLYDGEGTFIFTQDGIEIRDLNGTAEGNTFTVSGTIHGYSPEAPADLVVMGDEVVLPPAPPYMRTVPGQVREIYDRLRPQGMCSVRLRVARPGFGEPPAVTGEVRVIDGRFIFDQFPYPIRSARGRIIFGYDPETGLERVEIRNLRGRGLPDGPNRDSTISISGWIGPFDANLGVHVRVEGTDVHSEPALRAAFPREVDEALRIFDLDEQEGPTFQGRFVCEVIRPIGRGYGWTVNTDLWVEQASGALAAFPYPLEGVSCQIRIREGMVEIIDARMNKADATLLLEGQVTWGEGRPPTPDLKVIARSVPVDQDLLGALPEEHRQWVERLGVGGRIDIEGTIFAPHPEEPLAAKTAGEGASDSRPGQAFAVDYDLQITVRDGTVWPKDGTFTVSGVSGRMRLHPQRLVLEELKGQRGDAELGVKGTIAWTGGEAQLDLEATARNLLLDAPLYGLLPAEARAAWDEVRPEGTVDADLSYRSGEEGIDLVLQPRALSVMLQTLPYRLKDLKGTVKVTPHQVVLDELKAAHGEGTFTINGTGALGRQSRWDLQVSGDQVTVDEAFAAALPGPLAELVAALKLQGKIGFDFSRLLYSPGGDGAGTALAAAEGAEGDSGAAAEGGEPKADVEFAGAVRLQGASLETGVALDEVRGTIDLNGAVRAGELAELSGSMDLRSLKMAGRSMRNVRGDLYKPEDEPRLRIGSMQAELAGGELAGQVDLSFPDEGPSRYGVNLVVHNADVRELAGESDQEIRGSFSASLAVEGSWDDPHSRHGRGDVLVSGRRMYRIPVVMGLLHVTNLALPITSPFNEGTTRYSIDGSRVTFEQIELRSSNMLMQGSGFLDFETKRVRMTFVTDHPVWMKLPVVGDLLSGARQELLQIHVRGTIEDPKVSATAMPTFQTTVDEVFRGDGR